jgi:hypothetical protein
MYFTSDVICSGVSNSPNAGMIAREAARVTAVVNDRPPVGSTSGEV